MKIQRLLGLLLVGGAASAAFAHGPQIQLTIDNNKLTNRELTPDLPYSTRLSDEKRVYAMPVVERPGTGIWYSRPNNSLNNLGQPVYYSGPGIAFGYDQVDGGPEAFTVGSLVSVGFTTGLKKWDGSSLVDAGATELEIFRSTLVAKSSDTGPFASINFNAIPAPLNGVAYMGEGVDAHNTTRFRFLGDGLNQTAVPADGVYVVGLRYATTQAGVAPSDPFYFVLHKNAASADVAAAARSLGFAANQVQFVPEPATIVLIGAATLAFAFRSRS